MRKVSSIISLFLVAIMLFSFSACGNQDINGKYKMVGIYRDGTDYSDKLTEYYTEETIPTLTINDTKAVSVMDGVTDTFEIDYSTHTMTTQGVSIPYSVSGNRITLSNDGKKMVFEKVE